MHRLAITTLLLTAMPAYPAAAQLLVLDRVEGNRRTCYYRPDRTVPVTASASTDRRGALGSNGSKPIVVRLDSWRKCPAAPPAAPQQREEDAIPAFATLSTQRIVDGENTCIYSYAGRDYYRTMPTGRTCPYTPTGF